MNKTKLKPSTIVLIITGVITAVICAVMNFYLIPLIENSAGGIKCFDMSVFGYSPEEARLFVSSLSQEAKDVYLNIQLPLDFIYPVSYCIFFILCITKMSKYKWISVIPAFLAVADYTENICTLVMLKNESFSDAVALTGKWATTVKTVLMYITILIVWIMFVIFINKLKQAGKLKFNKG